MAAANTGSRCTTPFLKENSNLLFSTTHQDTIQSYQIL